MINSGYLLSSIRQALVDAYWQGAAGMEMHGPTLAHYGLSEYSIAAGVNSRNIFHDNYQWGIRDRRNGLIKDNT
jgi:hypothetical protein